MATVYRHVIDELDFCETVDEGVEGTPEWETYLDSVANRAAEPSGCCEYTEFEMFLYEKGYTDKIGDVLYDAMKAFTNECIRKDKAGFDYC